ncbi:hypothetical protein [Nakamurella leprariae]|uniref:Uncharacterized protein n=1 Tax=Nakamurella leprariae TaxID=2803911 RepID=A0A938YD99_9ACTN|nr:hypothetical protein [Nakamurella leprariae]MBM9465740.1 hypothetical protein [Nakamurella leprariae]
MSSPQDSALEAPDADWVEQHQPLSVDPDQPDAGLGELDAPDSLPNEADAADVQEQAVPVAGGEEEEYPAT